MVGDPSMHLVITVSESEVNVCTDHISDVENLSVHGLFVVVGRGCKPELLECFVHQFL